MLYLANISQFESLANACSVRNKQESKSADKHEKDDSKHAKKQNGLWEDFKRNKADWAGGGAYLATWLTAAPLIFGAVKAIDKTKDFINNTPDAPPVTALDTEALSAPAGLDLLGSNAFAPYAVGEEARRAAIDADRSERAVERNTAHTAVDNSSGRVRVHNGIFSKGKDKRKGSGQDCETANPVNLIDVETVPYETVPYETVPYETVPYETVNPVNLIDVEKDIKE